MLSMKMKLTVENEDNEVEYLELKVKRICSDGTLLFKWFQKDYSAKRIVDFYSYHPRVMKDNVVSEFIRNSLNLSSKVFWKETIDKIRATLRNSNHPNMMVEGKIGVVKDQVLNDGLNVRKRDHEGKIKYYYVSCPYYDPAAVFARKVIDDANVEDLVLAPSIVSSNGKIIFASMKDREAVSGIINAKFKWECNDCVFFEYVYTGKYDIERTMSFALSDVNSDSYKHCESSGHTMKGDVKGECITRYNSYKDCSIAKGLFI